MGTNASRARPGRRLTPSRLTPTILLDEVRALNRATRDFTDSRGKRLLFSVPNYHELEGLFFWRFKARVQCQTVFVHTSAISNTRLFTLASFCRIHSTILEQAQVRHAAPHGVSSLNASVFLQRVMDDTAPLDIECIICMDRKANTILPCAHEFCTQCISSWERHNSQGTCPLCRERLGTMADNWELVDMPSAADVGAYLTDDGS